MTAYAWESPVNAVAYDAFDQRYPTYRISSSRLADEAALAPGERVVDLACGTGATTRQILTRVGPAGTITGVDASPAMLDVAGRNIRAPNVRWVTGQAERLDSVIDTPVDAVVCNMAFWQLTLAPTLSAIARVLRPGGRLAFTISHRLLPPGHPMARDRDGIAPMLQDDEATWVSRLEAHGFTRIRTLALAFEEPPSGWPPGWRSRPSAARCSRTAPGYPRTSGQRGYRRCSGRRITWR